jgi:hypothetical protein
MPFDGTNADPAAAAFARFRKEPTLLGLAYALEHPEVMPAGFQWHFPSCGQCAMGLAAELLGATIRGCAWFPWAARTFGVSLPVVFRLFGGATYYAHDVCPPQPHHVAAQIRAYLASV